jgi:hypothetical protein
MVHKTEWQKYSERKKYRWFVESTDISDGHRWRTPVGFKTKEDAQKWASENPPYWNSIVVEGEK